MRLYRIIQEAWLWRRRWPLAAAGLIAAVAPALAVLPAPAAARVTRAVPAAPAAVLASRASSSSRGAFLATTKVGRYTLLLMASRQTLVTNQAPGQLVVELIRSASGAPGSEIDSYVFHLKGAFLTVHGNSAQLRTGNQLGHFGAINLRLAATRTNPRVGCGQVIAGTRGGTARGSLRFLPGGGYFGTISRRSLSGALATVSFSTIANACHGAKPSLPSTQPTVCPPAPELLLTAVSAAAPEAVLEVAESGGDTQLVLTALQESAPALLIEHQLLASLPAADWSASGGSGQLSVSGSSAFAGALSFTGISLPGGISGCADYEGASSGGLTASFNTIGRLSLGPADGVLIG